MVRRTLRDPAATREIGLFCDAIKFERTAELGQKDLFQGGLKAIVGIFQESP